MLVGPGNVLAEFQEAFGDSAFKKFSIFGRAFDVKTLSTDAFASRFVRIPSVFSHSELTNLLADLCYGPH